MILKYQHALIVGAGSGLSASLAKVFVDQGLRVTMAARTVDDLEPLCREIGATALVCDATDENGVDYTNKNYKSGEYVLRPDSI